MTILIDFWSPSCGACKMISPAINALATKYKDHLEVWQVQIEENPEARVNYKIDALPTLVMIRDGNEVGRHVGNGRYAELESFVTKHING